MTLSVNLIALYLGSSIAYALVAGIQLACIVMLNFADSVVQQLTGSVSYKKANMEFHCPFGGGVT